MTDLSLEELKSMFKDDPDSLRVALILIDKGGYTRAQAVSIICFQESLLNLVTTKVITVQEGLYVKNLVIQFNKNQAAVLDLQDLVKSFEKSGRGADA